MPRIARARSRTITLTGNRNETYTVLHTSKDYPVSRVYTSTCNDFVGRPVSDGGLSLVGYTGKLSVDGKVYGQWHASSYGEIISFDKYPLNVAGALTGTPFSAPNGWYLTTIARSNPSRPVLTPLTLGQDLIDIPKQLRDLGRILTRPKKLLTAKEQSSQYLGFQFGWMPLVEDVKQLLDLQSSILKREKELTNLYSATGLRRRIPFDTAHTVGNGQETFALMGPSSLLTLPYSYTTAKRSWATIHWKPTTPPKYGHGYDESMNSYARRIVLGLTPEGLAKGTWDIIPWTWLIGWFTNVGQYTLAYSNTVPASHSGACFMSEVDTLVIPGIPTCPGARLDHLDISGAFRFVLRTRMVSGQTTVGFNLPYLSKFQASILSALTIQRILRR